MMLSAMNDSKKSKDVVLNFRAFKFWGDDASG